MHKDAKLCGPLLDFVVRKSFRYFIFPWYQKRQNYLYVTLRSV